SPAGSVINIDPITETDLLNLPYHYTYFRMFVPLSFDVPASGIKTPSAVKKFRGDFLDLCHLGGGSYCEIFTCDKRTSDYIGDARQKLGLPRQIAIREPATPTADHALSAIERML